MKLENIKRFMAASIVYGLCIAFLLVLAAPVIMLMLDILFDVFRGEWNSVFATLGKAGIVILLIIGGFKAVDWAFGYWTPNKK